MIIIRGLHNFKPSSCKLCLSMGNFDGLHLGHQRVIKKMTERASEISGKGMIFTFNPHPRWVLTPDSPTLLLTTLHERVDLLSQWKLDILLLARFDRRLATLDPERFVKDILINTLGVSEIFAGKDFAFGHKKAGSIASLKGLGEKYGFIVNKTDLLKINGEVISSSLIRKKIQEGQIEAANRLLGYEYCITGKVTKGTGRGWHMGYPTANLKVVSKVIPPKGVYLVKVGRKGRQWHGLANLGTKPTFCKGGDMGIEVYIFSLNEDLYGQKLRLYFQKRIRDEVAFPSPQELTEQIKKDISKAHQWINQHLC
ncbi:MAG: bifunctional riboflavin kinase/FAD synthetase [bacterium]